MSDSNGSPTAPQAPDFSVQQPKTDIPGQIPVKSISYALDPKTSKQTIAERRSIRKGESPGSFAPTVYQTSYNQLVKSPLQVDGIKRPDPESKGLINFAKAAKEVGIEPVHDKDGNIISVTLPEGFIPEEDHTAKLAQVEAINSGDMRILRELLAVSVTFIPLAEKGNSLTRSLQDPSMIASIETISEEGKKLIDEIQEHPNQTKLDGLKEKLVELRTLVTQAEEESKKTAGAALTPEKTEVEKRAERQQIILELSFEVDSLLREARSLEGEISDNTVKTEFANATLRIENLFAMLKRTPEETTKNQFDAAYAAYKNDLEQVKLFIQKNPKPVSTPASAGADPSIAAASTSAPHPLPTGIQIYGQWTFKNITNQAIQKDIRAVFDEYVRFMQDVEKAGVLSDFMDVVEQKWDVAEAIIDTNVSLTRTLVERMKELLKEKRIELQKLIEEKAKMEELKKACEELKKKVNGAWNESSKSMLQTLRSRKSSDLTLTALERLLTAAQGVKTRIETELNTNQTTLTLEKIAQLNQDFENAINPLQEALTAESNKLDTLSAYTGAPEGMRGPVLRPIVADKRNENQKIWLPGNKETTVGERQRELEEAERQKSAGDDIEKTKALLEAKQKFTDMYARDPDAFTSLYVDTRTDPETGEKTYTRKLALEKHPYKDVIEGVLTVNGIVLLELTPNEAMWEKEEIKKVVEGESLMKHREMYTPNAVPNPATDPHMGDMANRERAQEPMAKAYEKVPKPDAAKAPDAAPNQALTRVGKLMSTLDARIGKGKMYIAAAVLGIAGGTFLTMQQMKDRVTEQPSLGATQPGEPKLTWRNYFHYPKTNPEYEPFADDMSKLDNVTLVAKYNKNFFSASHNPKLALTWFTDYILDAQKDKDGKIIDTNVYRLSPEARQELSVFVKVLNDMSMALSGVPAQGLTLADKMQDVRQKQAQKES